MADFSEETKLAVWKKAQIVSNNDPDVWRKDQYVPGLVGNTMVTEPVNMDGR